MSFRSSRRASIFREESDGSSGTTALLPVDKVQFKNPEYNAFTASGIASIIVGVLVGGILCFTNTYFGLTAGWVTMGSLQSTLLGFGLIKALSLGKTNNLFGRFGPLDNVLLQTTAVATATMPLAAGFVGIIPALEKLDPQLDNHEPVKLNFIKMLAWSFALCYFGVFFAVPLRRQTILKEKLKFPSGTATAQMIRVLHKMPSVTEDDELAEEVDERRSLIHHDEFAMKEQYNTPLERDITQYQEEKAEAALWRNRWIALGASFLSSGLLTVFTYFVKVVGDLQVFEWVHLPGATDFYWWIKVSLSYGGQGMIMGIKTSSSMMLGAIVGWAILGPISLEKGWSKWLVSYPDPKHPPVEAYSRTPTNWILWISLAIMLTEAVVGLGVMLIKMIIAYKKNKAEEVHDPAPPSQSVPHWLWISGLIVSSALCIGIVTPLFGIAWYDPLVALLMSLLVSVLAVRALGETDFNPVSGVGKIAQIVLSFVSPGQIVPCLVAGAIAEAGATQAGDLLQDLKTGHLLNASPRAMLVGQAIGSIFSVFFSAGAYALYASIYTIGQKPMTAPMANVWLAMSRVLMNRSLPSSVIPFCIGFAVLSGVITVIENVLPERWHKYTKWIPSPMAFAIGMFIQPNVTIPRWIGSIIQVIWMKWKPTSHTNYMIVVASGFVLGEGLFSILTLVFTATGIHGFGETIDGGERRSTTKVMDLHAKISAEMRSHRNPPLPTADTSRHYHRSMMH
ncbi:hypothetical protein PROFUN_01443 [Planoprotostelium fungivorum]|uniref:Oligopeptide transporter n=1 Tax=Planoprotostelium fungivorum TaxID=1890364 RepID=A0A2P6NTB1_9EUKA|nr:hypothetical protein PROFUN_01443 [Planoprotostelium fungivorum]